MAKVPFLCRRSVTEDTKRVELPFVQYARRVPSLDSVDMTRGWVRLQCAITDGEEDEGAVSRSVNENDSKVAREWFEALFYFRVL